LLLWLFLVDGSSAGYYFRPGTETGKYQIYFEGGGWCYSKEDCLGRSNTTLGSSVNWPATKLVGGLLSPNCTVNPEFCNWNLVHLAYCDGNSFSGNTDEPLVVEGKPLYFRGRRILDAVLRDITTNQGFISATEVMLTGCSAGGLSTYLHADYVASMLPKSVKQYGAVSISGFFLDSLNVDVHPDPVFSSQIQTIFAMSNASANVNSDCIKAQASDQQWRCNMAQYTLPFIKTPIFAFQSKYDSWQAGCVLSAEPVLDDVPGVNGNCSAVPGWYNCSQYVEDCTSEQIMNYNMFASAMTALLQTNLKKVDGLFLVSCHTHCEAHTDNDWMRFQINGVTMPMAVQNWWLRGDNSHNVDCEYNFDSPHRCNPTC